MSQSEQLALSRKYIPLPLAFVPVEEGIAIFLCRGCDRELLTIAADAAALQEAILTQFAADSAAYEERKRRPQTIPAYDFGEIDADTLFNLNEVDFTL